MSSSVGTEASDEQVRKERSTDRTERARGQHSHYRRSSGSSWSTAGSSTKNASSVELQVDTEDTDDTSSAATPTAAASAAATSAAITIKEEESESITRNFGSVRKQWEEAAKSRTPTGIRPEGQFSSGSSTGGRKVNKKYSTYTDRSRLNLSGSPTSLDGKRFAAAKAVAVREIGDTADNVSDSSSRIKESASIVDGDHQTIRSVESDGKVVDTSSAASDPTSPAHVHADDSPTQKSAASQSMKYHVDNAGNSTKTDKDDHWSPRSASSNKGEEFNASFEKTKEFGGSFDNGKGFDASFEKTKEFEAFFEKTKEFDTSSGKTNELDASFDKTKEFDASFDKTKEDDDSIDKTNEDDDSIDKTKEVDDSFDKTKEVDDSFDKTKEFGDSFDKTKEFDSSFVNSAEFDSFFDKMEKSGRGNQELLNCSSGSFHANILEIAGSESSLPQTESEGEADKVNNSVEEAESSPQNNIHEKSVPSEQETGANANDEREIAHPTQAVTETLKIEDRPFHDDDEDESGGPAIDDKEENVKLEHNSSRESEPQPEEPHAAQQLEKDAVLDHDPRTLLHDLKLFSYSDPMLNSDSNKSLTEDMVSLKEYFEVMKESYEAKMAEKTAGGTNAKEHVMCFEPNVCSDADRIIATEDTDDRPCTADPELDEEINFEVFPHVSDPSSPESHHSGEEHERNPETEQRHAPPLDPDSTCASSTFSEKSGHTSSIVDLFSSLDIPANAAPLPDASAVLASGSILTRSSLRTIVLKKWHQTFWVRYGPTSLFVFRSKDDFEDWLQNPYHTQRQRNYLIKVRIEFLNDLSKKTNVRGYKMTDVKVKAYEKKGPVLHQFKLERWTDLGVNIVVAFASPNPNEVQTLRGVIQNCMEKCPDHGLHPIDDLVVK